MLTTLRAAVRPRSNGTCDEKRQLFPLFDAAYLGFDSGNIDNDNYAIRHFVDDLGTKAGVCLSFAKDIGLYGIFFITLACMLQEPDTTASEQIDCLMFAAGAQQAAANTQSLLEMLQHSQVSNLPAYGAKVAAAILGSEDFTQVWYTDLITELSGSVYETGTVFSIDPKWHVDSPRGPLTLSLTRTTRCSGDMESSYSTAGDVWLLRTTVGNCGQTSR